MQLFLIVFSVFLLSVLGMSIGVMLGQKKLKGSCGGVGNIPGLKSDCSCENPCDKKDKKSDTVAHEHPVTFH